MKRTLIVISVVLVALVIFGAGFAFAQSQLVFASGLPQAFGPGGMMGGRDGFGQIQEYVEQALADKLGITKAELETQLFSGKSIYQVALDKGIAEANVTALLTEVHKTALAKVIANGLLTQAQADTMLQNLTANGFNASNCLMYGGNQGGNRYRGGRGGLGMQGGIMGRWNQQTVPTQVP